MDKNTIAFNANNENGGKFLAVKPASGTIKYFCISGSAALMIMGIVLLVYFIGAVHYAGIALSAVCILLGAFCIFVYYYLYAIVTDFYTPEYYARFRNGKEFKRIYWETVDSVKFGRQYVGGVGGGVAWFGSTNYFRIDYTFVNQNKKYVKKFISTYCTVGELDVIQDIIPVPVSKGKFLNSPKRREELKELKSRRKEYSGYHLYDISIRGRVAYLICCLENVFKAQGVDLEQKRRILERLWSFTSCENAEEWGRELKASLPENWADNLASQLVHFICEVACAGSLPENLGFTSVNCSQTLDIVRAAETVLTENNVPLPQIAFDDYKQYFLFRDGTRSPVYGIGLPFDGLGQFSALSKGKANSQIVTSSADLPRFKDKNLKMPANLLALMNIGIIWIAASIATYFVSIFVQIPELSSISLILSFAGILSAAITCVFAVKAYNGFNKFPAKPLLIVYTAALALTEAVMFLLTLLVFSTEIELWVLYLLCIISYGIGALVFIIEPLWIAFVWGYKEREKKAIAVKEQSKAQDGQTVKKIFEKIPAYYYAEIIAAVFAVVFLTMFLLYEFEVERTVYPLYGKWTELIKHKNEYALASLLFTVPCFISVLTAAIMAGCSVMKRRDKIISLSLAAVLAVLSAVSAYFSYIHREAGGYFIILFVAYTAVACGTAFAVLLSVLVRASKKQNDKPQDKGV